MALHSMTGFGSATAETSLDDGSTLVVSVEVRSVNHRHLQSKLRLGSEYSSLEPALDGRIRARLGRGAIQASFDAERVGEAPTIEVDGAAVERYLAAQRRLGESFELTPITSVAELFALPGVLVQGSRSSAPLSADGAEARVFGEALDGALDALLEMRAREGGALVADLRSSAQAIAALVGEIGERAPELVQRQRARLVERVAELSGNTGTTEADLAREIALLSDRLDVSEELSRLQSHLDQLDGMLGGSGATGRKLDFLAQEFFREANTIGSKCSDAEVAHLVVDLKTHVERLREQVQNVE